MSNDTQVRPYTMRRRNGVFGAARGRAILGTMKIVADLHIHSHFSRATSKNLTFEHLARWAQLKGIHVVGTGDVSHPGWLAEMREKLEPADGSGLYRLREPWASDVQGQVPASCHAPVRFILGGEISNIYKRDGQTRKVHNVIFAPSLDAVGRLQARLEKIGNIRSDGRPILGLDSRDLLETVLEVDPACRLIPAHIWTPWFSMLGSKSGFDSVEACYADLTPHIFALETGLSSDPPMNWRVSQLDRYTLVSSSDAHSPEKLGREATVFDTELSYEALFDALRTGDPATFRGTIEFFPEEGKYHLDGHRNCGVVWEPAITREHGGICAVCGKPVTIGVMHRVEELADRPVGARPACARPFTSLIPLPEVIGQTFGVGPGSGRVAQEYQKLLGRLGPELAILQSIDLGEIAAASSERLADGLGRMRRGEVDAQAGYDGEYGVIRLFTAATGRAVAMGGQIGLFGEGEGGSAQGRGEAPGGVREETAAYPAVAAQAPLFDLDAADEAPSADAGNAMDGGGEDWHSGAQPVGATGRSPLRAANAGQPGGDTPPLQTAGGGLNDAQAAAVRCVDRPLIISAGPGTGKTRTLTHRIAHLVTTHGVSPSAILAITFTNKAAHEMRERLDALLGARAAAIMVRTFHSFAAGLLREHATHLGLDPRFVVVGEDARAGMLSAACPALSSGEVHDALRRISDAKNRLVTPEDDGLGRTWAAYQAALAQAHALDFDDLIGEAVRLLSTCDDVRAQVQERYRYISVDEYQDVNAAQVALLRLLAPPDGRANLCVIGDPDQAIYGFRGADRSYFGRFTEDYPDAVVLRLSDNYRSTQVILDAALQVIGGETWGGETPPLRGADAGGDYMGGETPPPRRARDATERGGKAGTADVEPAGATGRSPLHAAGDVAPAGPGVARSPLRAVAAAAWAGGIPPLLDVYAAPTDRAEAEYVVHQVEQLVGGVSHFSLDSGRATGDVPAAERSFAEFAVLYRLGAQSRGLVEAFDRSGIPYQTVGQAPLTSYADIRAILDALWGIHNPEARLHAAAGARRKGSTRTTGAGRTRRSAPTATGEAVAQMVVHMAEGLRLGRDPASAARVEQLARLAEPFGAELGPFLETMALHKETDAYDPRADRVTLMTLHASKGLEFPVVFIVGCEEGLLPYVRQGREPAPGEHLVHDGSLTPGEGPIASEGAGVDEERRLFYVGMTRAREKLVLCHARRRMLFGQTMENPPSRFIDDIQAALKVLQEAQARRRPKVEDPQLSLF